MTKSHQNGSENSQTISAKIAQLNQDIEWFYSDDFELDAAVAKYQAASQLAGEIEQELAQLKNQVELIEDFTKS